MKNCLFLIVICLLLKPVFADSDTDRLIFTAMGDELERSKGMSLPNEGKPLYIAYYLALTQDVRMKGCLGTLLENKKTPVYPMAVVKLLLGNYEETSQVRFGGGVGAYPMPLDLDYLELCRRFWLLTDGAYKNATFNMADKKTHKKVAVKEEKELDDWTSAEAITRYIPMDKEFCFNQSQWEEKVRRLSAIFKDYPDLHDSEVTLSSIASDVYMKNSEGTTLKYPVYNILLRSRIAATHNIGVVERDGIHWVAQSEEELPSMEEMEKQIRGMCEQMLSWKNGAVMNESYSGPVLLEGNVIPATFYRLHGSLFKRERKDNQLMATRKGDFNQSVGIKVVDSKLTITNHTKMKTYKGIPVCGAYEVDSEGVIPADETVLIENGVLKNFLNDRVPKSGIKKSTGSAKLNFTGGNFTPEISCGVLQVSSSKTEKSVRLKEKLLKAAKQEGLSYAYIIRSTYDGERVYKVDVGTGEETIVTDMNYPWFQVDDFRHILGISEEEVVYMPDFMFRGHMISMITPKAMLLEKCILRSRKMHSDRQKLESPLKRMSEHK